MLVRALYNVSHFYTKSLVLILSADLVRKMPDERTHSECLKMVFLKKAENSAVWTTSDAKKNGKTRKRER